MPLDYEQTATVLIRASEQAVAKAVAPLLKRIEDLESRQPERGEAGLPGERGADGPVGRDGIGLAGAVIDRSGSLVVTLTNGDIRNLGCVIGPQGERGEKGDVGERGMAGEPGPKGEKGDAGAQGPQGEPGNDGADGKDGRDGVDGKDGANGSDGAAGSHGQNGSDGKDAYPGQARGLYDPEASYRALDVVSLNGSEWRAKKDDPGPLPGEDWMLSAQRGKRGEQGVKGERGLDGKQGRDGAQPITMELNADEMKLQMVLDDGNLLEADFAPVVRAIRGEE